MFHPAPGALLQRHAPLAARRLPCRSGAPAPHAAAAAAAAPRGSPASSPSSSSGFGGGSDDRAAASPSSRSGRGTGGRGGGRGGRGGRGGGRGRGGLSPAKLNPAGPVPGLPRPSPSTPQRLAKVMAAAGVASRRACETLISEGRVSVDGEMVSSPATLVTPATATIRLDGGPPLATSRPADPIYFAINKPKGYLCSADAPGLTRGRPDGRRPKLVTDLLSKWLSVWRARHAPPVGSPTPPPTPPRLYTVGRLDAASTGLILVTNDGAWAQAVAHPASGLTKEYLVTLARPPTRADLDLIAGGSEIDGATVQPVAVFAPAIIPGDPLSRRRIRVVIAEGRNREVRRLAEAAGHDVVALKRTRVGGLKIPKGLGIGGVKQLDAAGASRVTDLGLQGNLMANPYD